MLHSLAIRLICVHQLVTLFLFYGVKCQSGVIWGHWGRKVIFAENALTRPWYIAWPYDSYMSISLRPSIFVSGSNVNLGSTWGHPGRVRRLWRQQILVILPAQPQDLVSYSFLLSSSSFFFFLLATHLFHTLPYIWFWPNLLTVTGTLTTTHTLKMVGSGVTMGSLGSKRSFSPKRIKSFRLRSIDAWLLHMQ